MDFSHSLSFSVALVFISHSVTVSDCSFSIYFPIQTFYFILCELWPGTGRIFKVIFFLPSSAVPPLKWGKRIFQFKPAKKKSKMCQKVERGLWASSLSLKLHQGLTLSDVGGCQWTVWVCPGCDLALQHCVNEAAICLSHNTAMNFLIRHAPVGWYSCPSALCQRQTPHSLCVLNKNS